MNVDEIFSATSLDIENQFPGLRDTEDLKDCVKDISPLQDNFFFFLFV